MDKQADMIVSKQIVMGYFQVSIDPDSKFELPIEDEDITKDSILEVDIRCKKNDAQLMIDRVKLLDKSFLLMIHNNGDTQFDSGIAVKYTIFF